MSNICAMNVSLVNWTYKMGLVTAEMMAMEYPAKHQVFDNDFIVYTI